ncbi:MAG: hypothetical protein OJF51_004944 [Nitrospira sp.]|nr:MAG: hypothetical protein OJF51_004944 [Nitrospira sp.]
MEMNQKRKDGPIGSNRKVFIRNVEKRPPGRDIINTLR